MNYKILRFVELLKESMEIDDVVIKDLTDDLKDELDIEFDLTKGYLSKESLKKGLWGDMGQLFKRPTTSSDKVCYRISINLKNCGANHISEKNADYPIFEANKVLEILNALSQINQRVGDCYIQISGNIINFFVCSDEEVENDELYKLYTEIKNKINNLKSDFGYGTTVKIEDNKIIIKSDMDFYTDRKLNLALRGIQIPDKYNVTKTTEGEGLRGVVFNTIELR